MHRMMKVWTLPPDGEQSQGRRRRGRRRGEGRARRRKRGRRRASTGQGMSISTAQIRTIPIQMTTLPAGVPARPPPMIITAPHPLDHVRVEVVPQAVIVEVPPMAPVPVTMTRKPPVPALATMTRRRPRARVLVTMTRAPRAEVQRKMMTLILTQWQVRIPISCCNDATCVVDRRVVTSVQQLGRSPSRTL